MRDAILHNKHHFSLLLCNILSYLVAFAMSQE
jgi:hypothetical protein